MAILLVVLFLGVVGLGIKSRTNPGLRVPATVLALVAVAVAGVRLVSTSADSSVRIDVPPEEALGFMLANQVLEDYPDGGKVIVFLPETDEEKLLRIFDARMDGVRQVLRDNFELVSGGPQLRLGVEEDEPSWHKMNTGFPLASFQEWAAEDGDAVAAISLMGMPKGRLSGELGLPPLYVAELGGVNWDPNKLPPAIASVVMYREDSSADPQRTKELRAVFEQNFTMYPSRPDSPEDAEGDAAEDPFGG